MSDIELSVLEVQQKIHEQIARHDPLEQILDAIIEWVGIMMPGALVAIMRFRPDTNSLRLLPNSRFSNDYFWAMQNVPVSKDAGTCSQAALAKKLAITRSIQQDPSWGRYHNLAKAEEVHACWSMPILTSKGDLLGTLAIYHHVPVTPTAETQRYLTLGATLAALAILRHRDTQDLQAFSERHQALFDNYPYGLCTVGLDGRFQSCNAAMESVIGYTASHIHGLHFDLCVEPEYRAQTQAAFNKARNGETITYETRGIRASGQLYFIDVTNFPVTVRGEIIGVYGICRDITDRKDQDVELRLLKRGIEASPNGMLIADARSLDVPVVYASPAFSEITGYTRSEIVGHSWNVLHGENTDPEAVKAIEHGLRHQTEVNVELINYRKDGTPFWSHLRISPVFDDDGLCTHFISNQQDISHQKEQQAQITYRATHDWLTGLPNEASFKKTLHDALMANGERGSLVAMCLGLDGFKPINKELDTL
jgi:PAS domain S-box-containing protein